MTTKPLLKNLAKLPRLNDLFVWCDYIELRCLVHPDKVFSRSDLMETQEEMADTRDDADEIEDEQLAEDMGIDYNDVRDDGLLSSNPLKQDRLHRITYDRFLHLQSREKNFGEDLYPFVIDEELQTISMKDNMTAWQMLYVQLLLSSALRYCENTRSNELTGSFESVSLEIFKCLMPRGWEIHSFGKDHASRYTGHLFEKLSKLAEDVRGKLTLEKKHFHSRDYGDGGLDLVAWHPMSDERPNIPIAFGQCGCTAEDFENKMLQASPAKLGSHLIVGHIWANYYFMPHAMLSNDGKEWLRYSDFGGAIVIDRSRILKLAHQYGLQATNLFQQEVVDEVMETSFL